MVHPGNGEDRRSPVMGVTCAAENVNVNWNGEYVLREMGKTGGLCRMRGAPLVLGGHGGRCEVRGDRGG